jgi:hypothetical protein
LGIGLIYAKYQPVVPDQVLPECDVSRLYYQVQDSIAEEMNIVDTYPTKDRYYGKPAPVDFTSAPDAKRFYTRLTEGALDGPNAAGHYTIIQIGWTGNGFYTYVIDARTGKIIVNGQLENSQWKYAIDSDLIVAGGITNPSYFLGPPSEFTPAFVITSNLFLLRDGVVKEVKDLSWTFGFDTHNSTYE